MEAYSFRRHFLEGVRAAVPIMLGYIAVSIAYAIMAKQAGFSPVETMSMSAIVYAGASQMMAIGMIIHDADFMAIIVATFIVNFRNFIMSACVMERAHQANLLTRLVCAHGVADETFVIFTTSPKEKCTGAYMLGLFGTAFVTWLGGSFAGALASNFLPQLLAVSCGMALHAMFVSLIVPHLRGNARLAGLVLITALLNTIFGQFMASSWALVLSALLAAGAGVFFVDLPEEEEVLEEAFEEVLLEGKQEDQRCAINGQEEEGKEGSDEA